MAGETVGPIGDEAKRLAELVAYLRDRYPLSTSAISAAAHREGWDAALAADVPTLTVLLHADPALCRKLSPNGHPRWMARPLCRSVAERLAEAFARLAVEDPR